MVILVDNARVHKGSRLGTLASQRQLTSWAFHLSTIPCSPQLDAIEMVPAQTRSCAVSEFVQHPERGED